MRFAYKIHFVFAGHIQLAHGYGVMANVETDDEKKAVKHLLP